MKNGFTLIESLVTIVIFVLIIGAVYGAYVLNQRASREGEDVAELTQNGRVILERMTREIRQAKEIVTNLSATSTNATSTIEFEDGHDTSFIHYIRYFKDDNDQTIKREVIGYYFSLSGNPNNTSTYVTWDTTPPPGETLATTSVESPQIIGEWVSDLKIWKSLTVNIFLTLKKGEKTLNLETKIYGRNL
jgi:prepilin-type N-terminal cleavage/methylation domain-containing protein